MNKKCTYTKIPAKIINTAAPIKAGTRFHCKAKIAMAGRADAKLQISQNIATTFRCHQRTRHYVLENRRL